MSPIRVISDLISAIRFRMLFTCMPPLIIINLITQNSYHNIRKNQVNKISRIGKSRAVWKDKAVGRATRLRDQRKQIIRIRNRSDARQKELEQVIQRLHSEIVAIRAGVRSPTARVIDINAFARLRTLCVMMVIVGIVSFRSVPRILNLLRSSGILQTEIPHFTSVIHWTLRAEKF